MNVFRRTLYSIGAGMVTAGICHAFNASNFVMYCISWGIAIIIGAAPDRNNRSDK